MTLKPILCLLAVLASPAFAQEAEPPAAPPRDALITLVNDSSAMVMHFYVTPIIAAVDDAEGTAEETDAPAQVESGDLLAGGVISPGSNAVLNVPGGADVCTYDLRFELRDQRIVQGSTDICANDVFVIE